MKFKVLVLMAGFFLLLAGCQSKAAAPVEIKANEESCAECKMGIEELKSAAQIILEDGKPLLFDDIGCMINYLQQNSPKYEAAFIHDFETGEWIDFDKSTFVQGTAIESPMSYGIAGFESEEKATQYKEEHDGNILSKEELLKADMKSFKSGGMEHGH
ncbi:nitrous oxide reductase accessory protein NosL [Cytobacillus massiliigabonensis]|uniref:nitrous oxide reductase accessory protein NosL n=1 Tax=Cytobacillus massiliigabonensis TaxID=1871011 RepID=UPI000C83B1E9|nr:nitrous oxide reductase accessory protein NosL [Cytobacillus massiliigabonensis]